MATTALQLAKDHCANYCKDGSCLGVYYNRDLSIQKKVPYPKCILGLDPVQRCPYFEEIIMPMKLESTDRRTEERITKEFALAVKAYGLATGLLQSTKETSRPCPQCRQRPVEDKQKLCYICKDENRKSTFRSANSKRRAVIQQFVKNEN